MSEMFIQNERAIRVIIACSEEADRREMCERLGKDRRLLVKAAGNWNELKEHLNADVFDVVVMTGEVDGVSGIEINQNIKTLFGDPPATVMLDAGASAHSVIKAFRCGFADCLPQDSRRDADLRDAVMRAASIVSTAREQAQRLRDLERMAQRDSVTGLVNRYYLRDRLDQLIELGERHDVPFSAILVRVDKLDRIRGVFGTKVGDAVLYAFARRLQAASRKSATYGRLNDDSFLYLLEQDVTAESVAGACARLSAALTFSLDLDNVSLTLSATVAAGTFPEDGGTISELLNAAEQRVQFTEATAREESPLRADEDGERPEGVELMSVPAIAQEDGELRTAARRPAPLGQPEWLADIAVGIGAPAPAMAASPGATRMSDRRNAIRHRCLKRGILVFNNGFSTVNCLVRDLSSTGARIEVDGSFDALEAFELRLVESGQQFKVEKRWQNGSKFGLRFII
ncbi:MAG: diguanylate cyclase [Devosia sp.]|nr:diguanylate cyclase [Devosia sp.]